MITIEKMNEQQLFIKIGDKINIEVIDANKQEKRISFKRIPEIEQEESL